MAAALFMICGVASAQMTDDQIIEYVQSAMASGKDENQIAQELVYRGVTRSQLERLRDRYQGQQSGSSGSSYGAGSSSSGRTLSSFADKDGYIDYGDGKSSSALQSSYQYIPRYGVQTPYGMYPVENEQLQGSDGRTLQGAYGTAGSMGAYGNVYGNAAGYGTQYGTQYGTGGIYPATGANAAYGGQSLYGPATESGLYFDPATGTYTVVPGAAYGYAEQKEIFGHNLFNGVNLTFEPNENVATPEDYKLGPGDEVVIEVWGLNEDMSRQVISPEGRISISMVGPVYLNGLTIKDAEKKITAALKAKYAGIGGENPGTFVSVSLGNIRTIRVNVMGEVVTPGTFRMSSFSSVFSALYRAGGVTESGSLREIKVMRDGSELAVVDVYEYLFDGKSDSDITLKEGDVIVVPPYVNLVSVDGQVKRPMYYELTDDESLQNLIDYAGGFAGEAFRGDVSVVRVSTEKRQIYTVSSEEYSTFALEDGDRVSVRSNLSRFANRVEVSGYVFRPGMYELGGDIATVRQLVEAAGGVTEDAFLTRAILLREKENFDYQNISVDLGKLLSGEVDDIVLRRNDVLLVSGIHDVEDRGTLTINGFVVNPGVFPFAENTTVEDLVLRAGGLLDGASTARIDVARRLYDPASMESSDTLGFSFSFSMADGLAMDGGEDFVLEPYDVVSVRMSPGYRPQRFVSLEGQVLFPGEYVLLNEGERISDLIARAGGFTGTAYLKGARIVRQYRDNEVLSAINESIEKISASAMRDTMEVEMASEYVVSLDLAQAMAHPGSEVDIVLQEDDRIIVPEYVNTVQVMGEVMFPNAVVYTPGKSLRYYIDAAGGFTQSAKKSKAYVIYMNGSAARSGLGKAKVQPGCTIVVPRRPERRPVTTSDVLGTASVASSLASTVTVLLNLLK